MSPRPRDNTYGTFHGTFVRFERDSLVANITGKSSFLNAVADAPQQTLPPPLSPPLLIMKKIPKIAATRVKKNISFIFDLQCLLIDLLMEMYLYVL